MQETASQTNTFLSRIFGDEQAGFITLGFIPVDLSTGKRGKMVPEAFEWPKEKKQALAWIYDKSKKGEVFYCPALRNDRGRKKGNAVEAGLGWLWADVDMEKVPADRIEGVKKVISLLSTLTVRSGSGDNRHVYVRVEESLDKAEHEYLNTLLRDLLCADNKQADNSLLRVAGTYNYKALAHGKARNAVAYDENRKGGGRRGKSLKAEVVGAWLEKHWDKQRDRDVENGAGSGEDRDALRERLKRGGGYEDRGREGIDWIRSSQQAVDRICRGSVKALVGMTSEQVLAGDHRGKRYIAVKNVAERLYKNRLVDGDRNLVHTLMDNFEPGRDKERSERSYNLHRDLECVLDGVEAGLAAHEIWGGDARPEDKKGADKKGSESEGDDSGDAVEVLDDQTGGGEGKDGDGDPWNPDAEWIERKEAGRYWSYKIGESARRKLRGEQAALSLPTMDAFSTVKASNDRGLPEQQYLLPGLCGVGHNVTITAQYKTGKTTFAMNLARALVQDNAVTRSDGENAGVSVEISGKFLNTIPTLKMGDGSEGGKPGSGNGGKPGSAGGGWEVKVWSCEMEEANLVRDYINPMGLTDSEADRLGIWHLRGSSVDILSEEGMEWAIASLNVGREEDREEDSAGSGDGEGGGSGTRVWIIDSLARLAAMAGVEENDNSGMMQLLKRIDEIKKKAGIAESFVLVHTGRAEQESGKERARGATVVDDWADVRWLLTRDDMGHRYLRAEGRGVSMEETVLDFDKKRGLMTLGSGDRMVTQEKELVTLLGSLVQEFPGINMKKIKVLFRERATTGVRDDRLYEVIDECIELKMIKKRRGPRNSNTYYPVGVTVEEARSGPHDGHQPRVTSPQREPQRVASRTNSNTGTRKRRVSRGSAPEQNQGFDPEAYHEHMSDRPQRTHKRASTRMLNVWKDPK